VIHKLEKNVMAAKSKADLILSLYKFCKKEYPPTLPPSNRTVIENMLYGCCLENSSNEGADEAFAKLQENFFDWNEVRVTTASELAELMKRSTYPKQVAISIKKTLHGIFESYYQFDLDFLRKENLSKAVTQFEKFKGVSPFVVNYVSQNGLGGHSIPIDRAMMLLFYTLGIASEAETTGHHITGLERTISKSQGVEFFACVHQFAVAFLSSPFNTKIREQILKLNPDAKDRFPKRGAKKREDETPAEPTPAAGGDDQTKTARGRGGEGERKDAKQPSKKPAEPAKRGRPPVSKKPQAAQMKRGKSPSSAKSKQPAKAVKGATKRPKPR
jgi:endonuclease-3